MNTEDNLFGTLGVHPVWYTRLAQRGITVPTAVQNLVIPELLAGNSSIYRSATGTGKTLAYLIPALQRIITETQQTSPAGPALIVCAPTLELCSQIKKEVDFLLDGKSSTALLIGSTDMSRQIDSLKKNKPLAAVGNPGRLLLLAKMGKLKFGGLRFLVLDEADRLTVKECRDETTALVQIITDKVKNNSFPLITAACSATVSGKTRQALGPLLEHAQFLETDEHEILRERIQHWAIFSESRKKTQTLIAFIAAVKPHKALVFTSRSYDAGKIISIMQHRKIAAAALHSGMGKKERKEAIDRFRSGKAAVLISSDLAARGLDVPDISHVIALDVSDARDAYIHRAGRTGRAGKHGIMVSIGDAVDMRRLDSLKKKLGIKVVTHKL